MEHLLVLLSRLFHVADTYRTEVNRMNPRWPVLMLGGLLLALMLNSARGQNDEALRLRTIETSPRASFHILTYEREDDASPYSEVAIARDRMGTERRRLFRGRGSTSASVSPDERWIVLEIQKTQDYGTFEIFRYQGDLKVEHREAEVERRALALMMRRLGLIDPPLFAHFSCYQDAWSSDSESLLGHLEFQYVAGHTPGVFYFVYELETDQVTFDLGVFNRGAPAP